MLQDCGSGWVKFWSDEIIFSFGDEINFFNDVGTIIMEDEHSLKADNGNDFNFDSFEISMIWRFVHFSNAPSNIFETFDEMKISLIFEIENACFSIVCKLGSVRISIFASFLQLLNAYDDMILIFDGIRISLISLHANIKRWIKWIFFYLFKIGLNLIK